MIFRVRYVNYGTGFVAQPGIRDAERADSASLYANELAVDVGGVCWGHQGETIPVIDHHFQRDAGQFPSATAAVLHHAERIYERFQHETHPIWLVTHREPDFDAFAAMYLVRAILQGRDPASAWSIPHDGWKQFGILPDGWRQGELADREVDWFHPNVSSLPPERRWPILLAAFASCVDNCKPPACAKNRTLDAVLYAAMQRGRNYLVDGAAEFFDEVRERLQEGGVNPLYDSILEESPRFRPELSLLDRALAAYDRDIKRSRRGVIYVQAASRPFGQWYPEAAREPLLDDRYQLRAPHACPDGAGVRQVDAVFLRDPECLLFKNWARSDRENSSLGQGFTFTAIAYSGERSGSPGNTTNYFFALDPERAAPQGLHLYNVWARLQAAELQTLHSDERFTRRTPDARCRHGYEARAAQHAPLCDDPWYDGDGYACTIVATPGRGTCIGVPGVASDLSDDPIAQLVSDEVSAAALPGEVFVLDLGPAGQPHERRFATVQDALATLPPLAGQNYRFCRLQLNDNIDPTRGLTGEQTGRLLWQLLDVGGRGVAADFVEHHLIVTPDSVQVWNRAGVVVAVKASAAAQADQLQQRLRELVTLSAQVGELAAVQASDQTALRSAVARSEELTRQIANLRQYLTYPEARVLRRFFDATDLHEFLNTARDLHNTSSSALTAERLDTNLGYVAVVQNAVEWLEIFIVSFYAIELTHVLAEIFHFNHLVAGMGVLIIGSLTAGSVALALRPWAHHDTGGQQPHDHSPRGLHPLARALLLLGVLLILFLAIGFALPKEDHLHDARAPATASDH